MGKFALQLLVARETWKHLSDRSQPKNILIYLLHLHTHISISSMNPSEQGEALLCGTLPGPRGEGDEWSQGMSSNLMKPGWGKSRWGLGGGGCQVQFSFTDSNILALNCQGVRLKHSNKYPGIDLFKHSITQTPCREEVEEQEQHRHQGRKNWVPSCEKRLVSSVSLSAFQLVHCQLVSFSTYQLVSLSSVKNQNFHKLILIACQIYNTTFFIQMAKTEHSITRDIWAARYY